MIAIENLTGIPAEKRKEITNILEHLVINSDSNGLSPIISGFNWYNSLIKPDRIITFSHIHETNDYREDMLKSLFEIGYNKGEISNNIRDKGALFLWELAFRFRDKNGVLNPKLRVKSLETNKYVDLRKYKEPLIHYQEFLSLDGKLVGEGEGWELNIQFNNKQELLDLVALFLKKAPAYITDKNSGEKVDNPNAWKRIPHETPVLLLSKKALEYAQDLLHFIQATKFNF